MPSAQINRLMAEVQRKRDLMDPEKQAALYTEQAKKALPSLYAPAYQAISRQFEPQVARARASLGYNPAAANSGVRNILNRRLLQGAYGQLGDAMTGSTADVARGGLDLTSDLIKRRVQNMYDMQAAEAARKANKRSGLSKALGFAGAVAPFIPGGAAAAPFLAAGGQSTQ